MTQQPALFISHGSPMVLMEPSPGGSFMKKIPTLTKRPRAILSVTAHWMTHEPCVSNREAPETIYDFGGFPPTLYHMKYPAPGAPDVAEQATDLMRNQGLTAQTVEREGFDHGTWVPLKLAYPNADIPIAELSIQPNQDAAWHFKLGQALAPLRNDNVLILASGAITHNLHAYMTGRYKRPPDWVYGFSRWVQDAIVENRVDDLLNFESKAPYVKENHPTTEHLLPLFVALGAASPKTPGSLVHESIDYGVLAMDAYLFN